MKYRIYFNDRSSSNFDTVDAMNYTTNKEFATFYMGPMPGCDYVNVASYPTDKIAKIEMITEETTQEKREKKLKRIIKEDNIFKKIFNNIFNGN
jgi:hypothetical protein